MDIQTKIGAVIVDDNDSVLLIKEKLEKKPVALWNIVKGSYEGGETIIEAAIRECKEETSLDVELTESLGVYISEGSGKIRVQFNFLAHAKQEKAAAPAIKAEQEMRDEAIEEVKWFTKEEAQKLKEEEFVSLRSYQLLHDWLSGKRFPIDLCKHVDL